jgi:hypothetical protein
MSAASTEIAPMWLELSPTGIGVYTPTDVQKAMAIPPPHFLPGSFDPE